jgi:hypothetical protein
VLEAGRAAYLSGMRATEVVAWAVMLAMALLTLRLLRGGEPAREHAGERCLTLTPREATQWTP